ncbi:MAG: FAD binding domain-containing protein [Spirochaetales bacterium]|nr:FAD binding domain-containing protein [Spirochaetales bacterium]
MKRRVYSPIVYTPLNLNELNGYSHSHPKATIFAGGTYILPRYSDFQLGDFHIIDISHIEELNRISRTETYLEIGAGVSLNKILDIGKKVLPKNFQKAIMTVGNVIVRDMATLGGNIGNRDVITSLPPLLLMMDVRLEVRKNDTNRWIPFNQIYIPGRGPDLENWEFIQRIRIPLREWNFQMFRSQGDFLDEDRFLFCTFASVQKGIVTDIRFAFVSGWHTYIRSREIEVEMEGRKLPLSRSDITSLREHFYAMSLKNLSHLKDYQITQISRTFYWALHELSYSITE